MTSPHPESPAAPATASAPVTAADTAAAAKLLGRAIEQVQRVIVGQEHMVEQLMVALLAKGRKVTVIEQEAKLGNGIGIIDRKPELNLLEEGGVDLRASTRLTEVTANGIWVEQVDSGHREFIEVDTVILALGVETNEATYSRLKTHFSNIRLIGDATTPTGKVKRTLEAISEGYSTAMAV